MHWADNEVKMGLNLARCTPEMRRVVVVYDVYDHGKMAMTKKVHQIFGQEKCTPIENPGYVYGFNQFAKCSHARPYSHVAAANLRKLTTLADTRRERKLCACVLLRVKTVKRRSNETNPSTAQRNVAVLSPSSKICLSKS